MIKELIPEPNLELTSDRDRFIVRCPNSNTLIAEIRRVQHSDGETCSIISEVKFQELWSCYKNKFQYVHDAYFYIKKEIKIANRKIKISGILEDLKNE